MTMNNQQALHFLRRRGQWIESKITEFAGDGRSPHNLMRDREVNDLAIAAVEFVIATDDYEKSKS